MHIKSLIPTWNLVHKRVFLRTDYNVPVVQESIADTYRLDATLPTLKELSRKGATIIIGTHRGRPAQSEPILSTKHLIPWFEKNGYSVTFAPTIEHARAAAAPGTIVLLENLRFFPGEQSNDPVFAQQLASLADYYVNDSFGTLQNSDASTTRTPELFSADHRSIGLLIEKEIATLDTLVENPRHPFVVILGGAKVADKIPLINHMLMRADIIMLCPAIVFTFLKTMGMPVGASLIDDRSIPLCAQIMQHAKELNKKIMFPIDYLVSPNAQSGTLLIANAIPAHGMGISVGPRTVAEWTPIIKRAGTVFFNGAIGFMDKPETLSGMYGILDAMKHASGKTIVAGGDSVAIAHAQGVHGITHYALGGGAALAYLSGQSLPGLAPFTSVSKYGTKSE